ncbi:uncharacterized protein [Penaeus vannamei]|uniref:uncharacterized protein isoform X2 n=1 Tax=Penaeus vannamei TaxID=6689 RepID=UPI00387F69C5
MSRHTDLRRAFIPSPIYVKPTKDATLPAQVFSKVWLTVLQFLGLFPYKRSSSGEYQVSFPLLSWSFVFGFLMLCVSGFLFRLNTSQNQAFLLSLHISYFSVVVICLAFFLHNFQWRKYGVLFSRLESLLTSRDLPRLERPCRRKIRDLFDVKLILICVAPCWQFVEALLSVATGEGKDYGGLPFMIFYTLYFTRQCCFTLFIRRTFRVLNAPLENMELLDPWTLLDSTISVSSIWLQTLHARVVKVRCLVRGFLGVLFWPLVLLISSLLARVIVHSIFVAHSNVGTGLWRLILATWISDTIYFVILYSSTACLDSKINKTLSALEGLREFPLGGLFPLASGSLSSAASFALTYVVILVQTGYQSSTEGQTRLEKDL